MRSPNPSADAALFAVLCLVWGLTWWPAKVGAAHVPPIFLAAARFTLAGALMLAWAWRDAAAVPRSARGRLLATALLVNTGNYALLFWGIARAPTGLAAIVNFATIPVFSLLASRWLEGTPIGRRHVAAIALGTIGLTLLFASRAMGAPGTAPAADELWGLAAIALGTLLYCLGAVLSRPIATTMPVVTLAGWQTLIGGIGLVALALALEPIEAGHLRELVRWPTLPALLFLVGAGSLAGFTIYLRLLRDWGAFRAGLYAFVSPAVAVGVGVVVLAERFGWAEGVGAAIMFAAAAIAIRKPSAARKRGDDNAEPRRPDDRTETVMEKTAEQLYSDLLRMLAAPSAIQPAVLADALRDVERMHSMGHITDWQLEQAREAYAKTIEREPREGAPRSPETRADERD